MKLTTTPSTVTVQFSAVEVSQFGLPARGATITYANGRLENYSRWLERSERWDQAIDRLIALADACVPTLH